MSLKVTFFFAQAARGWTQTYYASGSSPSSWAASNINARSVSPFIDICANDVFLTEVRVSLVGSPRVTYSVPFNQQSINAYDNATNYNQDTYGEDALLLLRSAGGIPRHVWIRGLPNVYIVYNVAGIPQPPAELLQAVSTLQSAILALGLQVQNNTIPTPTSGLWYNVAFVAAGPGGAQPNSYLYCPTIPTFPSPLPPIYFQGIPKNDLPGFPRIITPATVTAGTGGFGNNVYVPYRYRGSNTETYPAKMKFALLAYTYNTITSVVFSTYGTRKTGRPTGLPRGRSSVAIRRQ